MYSSWEGRRLPDDVTVYLCAIAEQDSQIVLRQLSLRVHVC